MAGFSDDVMHLAKRAAAPAQAGIFAGDNPAEWNMQDPIRLWVIQVVIIVGVTQLLALLLARIRQPRVIAEVIGGVILGPSVMGHIPNFTNTIFPTASMPSLNLTANIGLLLFLFIVGMEIDTRGVRRNAKASFAISVAGLIIPLGLGAALAVPIYHEFTDGSQNFGYFILFVAVAIGITAFPVLCRILTELKLLDTTVGVVVLSAGVGNDVVGWVLLALSVALVNATSGLTALWVLLTAIGYVLFVCIPLRWAYRWLAKKTGSLDAGTPSMVMMTVTLGLVFVSGFFTDIIGIHAIFGGFLAGLIIPKDNGYAIALVEKIEDLVSILLLPLYFALSGLRTNLGLLDTGVTWGYIVLICVVAFFSKFLGCGITAKLTGFNLRESGAIGTLMSCKGLVELIVLNVGFSANILDGRTFSMFVVHALVLTFITTPLTLLFYPSKYRVNADALNNNASRASLKEEGGAGAPREDLQVALKTRFAVIVDRIEQLPAIMTLTQLLQSPSLAGPVPGSSSSLSGASKKTFSDEKAAYDELAHSRPTASSQITVDALRLIELTNRTSAVFKSQAADSLIHSDPILAILKTHGYLNRMAVSTSLAVVGYEEMSDNVAQHVRSTGSQMVILPWTSGFGEEDAPQTPAANEGFSAASPFDALFQQKRERDHSAVAAHSHFIRSVFAQAPADVALFWDRGFPQAFESGAQYHVFMPFFGGPDDRAALTFLAQLCTNASVTATVVKMKKVGADELTPLNSIEQAKLENLANNTVHSTVFPDTVYGALNTQTRLASETADSILWTRLKTCAVPEFAEALSRITFVEETSSKPLHTIVDLASRSALGQARQFVVVGRSRRMAVDSHQVELQELCAARNESLGTELPKTLGPVACAFVASGSNASLLVVQASQKV